MLDKLNPFSKEYKIKKEYLNIIKEYEKLVDYESDKSYDYLTSEIEIAKAKNDLIDINKKKLLFSFNLLRKEISKDINYKADLWKLQRLNKCKGKVFYIKKDLELPFYFRNTSRNVITLRNEDLLYQLQKDKIRNCNLQNFLEKALINKINRKEDRLYKGLRKAIINNSKIDFPDIRNMGYYYIYNKIKIKAKQYTRIFILDREFQIINRDNLLFFEYCSKKFNVDIIIPK